MNWCRFFIRASFFLLVIILSISCSKEDKEWNTLRWKMGDRAVGSYCEGQIRDCTVLSCSMVPCDPVSCRLALDLGNLSIHGGNENERIEFYKYRGLKIGAANRMEKYDHMIYKDVDQNEECREYNLDTTANYTFKIIQLDTLDRIIAGLFSFTAINNCNDTVEIEEGFFKITY